MDRQSWCGCVWVHTRSCHIRRKAIVTCDGNRTRHALSGWPWIASSRRINRPHPQWSWFYSIDFPKLLLPDYSSPPIAIPLHIQLPLPQKPSFPLRPRDNNMQTRRQLTRKSSNIENTPITPRGSLMKPLHGGAYRNGLHRIRRKVSGVKPYAFSAEQALKKRSLKIRPVAVAAMPTPPTTPKVEPADTPSPLSKPFPFNAPRHLQRPEFKDIPRANLVAIEPHLKDAPLPFIRDGLQIIGVGYVRFFSLSE